MPSHAIVSFNDLDHNYNIRISVLLRNKGTPLNKIKPDKSRTLILGTESHIFEISGVIIILANSVHHRIQTGLYSIKYISHWLKSKAGDCISKISCNYLIIIFWYYWPIVYSIEFTQRLYSMQQIK